MYNTTNPVLLVIAVDSVFSIGLSVFGLFGNLCVVCVFIQLKLSTTNFFILNLAILDILTCLCAMLKQILFILGELSSTACPLLQYFLYFSTSSSPFLLLAIATDRYRKVCQIHRWQMSLKHAKIVMVLTMLISAILSLPILFFSKLCGPSEDNRQQCVIQHKSIYSFIYFVVLFVLLLSVSIPIIFCYKQVCQAIKFLKYKQATNAEKVKRSTMTMSCVAIMFLLSYFPCLLVDVLDQKIAISTSPVAQIFHCLAIKSYLFSCIFNPVLYGYRDKRTWLIIKACCESSHIVRRTVAESFPNTSQVKPY